MYVLSSSRPTSPQGPQSKYIHGKMTCEAKQHFVLSWDFSPQTSVHLCGVGQISELCLESQQTEAWWHFFSLPPPPKPKPSDCIPLKKERPIRTWARESQRVNKNPGQHLKEALDPGFPRPARGSLYGRRKTFKIDSKRGIISEESNQGQVHLSICNTCIHYTCHNVGLWNNTKCDRWQQHLLLRMKFSPPHT